MGLNMKTTRWLPILMCLPLLAVRGHSPVLTKLLGYRFVAKKGTVPFLKTSVTEH